MHISALSTISLLFTIDSSLSLLLPGIADLLAMTIDQLVRNERFEFAAFAKGPRFRESRSRRIVQYTNKRNIHQVFIEFGKRSGEEGRARREDSCTTRVIAS